MNPATTLAPDLAQRIDLPPDAARVLAEAPSVTWPNSREHLVELTFGGNAADRVEVSYEVPDKGNIVEATVVRCRNGLAVNYTEAYMRRRDPRSMVVADDGPTDKERFQDRFGEPFEGLREEVFQWLTQRPLIAMPFVAGDRHVGYPAVMIGPANAAFFAAGLADLQSFLPPDEVPDGFRPRAIIYLAPPFRHSHCDGKQVVVHNRQEDLHEIFSLNLYPGPSAKKGIYGVLLTLGEDEGYVTLHGSTVKVVTPYDNEVTIMHEGASGGGKSEMLEYPHRGADGRLTLGMNMVTGERRYLTLQQGCQLQPVTDDMALCHPSMQGESGKVVVSDAEAAWFVRVNHIDDYGVDPNLERLCVQPPEPLVFLNIQGVPGATALIWEHTQDEPGVPCPNPRVILPRDIVPGVVEGAVEVDIRSFGVRTPMCTRGNPSYGIIGMLHVLPPALAWLWRLVAPRGHANPSITQTAGMTSEGVGSYWPFATGRRVDQANLLLRQIVNTPRTRFVLIPNQHIGSWKVGFMPQWISREYLARRGGAKFRPEQLTPARCPLLGHAMYSMQVEGTQIPRWFLQVDGQPEVGEEAYDAGANILRDFFLRELKPFRDEPDLDPLGRQIIKACFDDATQDEYTELLAGG